MSENLWVKLTWVQFPDSPYTPGQAMMLGKLGKLLIAHNHTIDPDHVVLMVKSPTPRRSS
jgi:hypothetical protein